MKFYMLIATAVILFVSMCDHTNTIVDYNIDISGRPSKWFNNHACAVSITCDISIGAFNDVGNELLNRSLTADIEMVTSSFVSKNKDLLRRVESYYARGLHFFGHGHEHWYFDTMSYDVAYAMFDTCYRLMSEWNLAKPFSCAYPYGAGNRATTQKAVADAGFICARAVCYNIDTFIVTGKMYDPDSLFICSDSRIAPSNWFELPAVCVGRDVPRWINNHTMMAETFDKNELKKAWIIIMYHSIGLVTEDAYYPMKDFQQDLDDLVASDVWVSNMDVIARYIHERNNCIVSYKKIGITSTDCTIETIVQDTLDTPYDKVPLTMVFDMTGDASVDRCDVVTPDGAVATYSIINSRFSINCLPDGTKLKMRFYSAQ